MLSGAYVVLEGAPAIVAAVNRYVVATDETAPSFVTDEVAAARALGFMGDPPSFDASALRQGDRKLGLGSSAAILVASLLASARPEYRASKHALFEAALVAHRKAQGGGSGIDVLASVYGGIAHTSLDAQGVPTHDATTLPRELVFQVWSSPTAASTREFVAKVQAAQANRPTECAPVTRGLWAAAERAVRAAAEGDGASLLAAWREQCLSLARLGALAGIPIVTEEVRELNELAEREGSVVLPAGAGGGDVNVYAGPEPPSAELIARRDALGHDDLGLQLGAIGATLVEEDRHS